MLRKSLFTLPYTAHWFLKQIKGSIRRQICTIVSLGPVPSTSTGCMENGWRAALRRRTGGCLWTRSLTGLSNVCSQTRVLTVSWVASKEGILLLCSHETPPSTLHPVLGPPTWAGHRPAGVASKIFRGLECISYGNRLREFGLRRT